jgi:hypothetical protein
MTNFSDVPNPPILVDQPSGNGISQSPLDNDGFAFRWGSHGSSEAIRARLGPVRAFQVYPGQGSQMKDVTSPSRHATKQPESPLKPTPPKWLMGNYKPRGLTQAGLAALEALGPEGEGFRAFPLTPLDSLEARRDMLAAKYTAMDLVQQGLAFEANGSYFPMREIHRRKNLGQLTILSLQHSGFYMDEMELLRWLALGRMLTLDQFIAIDPENAYNNVTVLREMADRRIVNAREVPMGKGTVEVWELGKPGWEYLCEPRHFPELKGLGYGPSRTKIPRHENLIVQSHHAGRRDFHSLIQTDAILWFMHDIAIRGGRVSQILLERALVLDGGNQLGERRLDFRIYHEAPDGRQGTFDVEVVGVGSAYRSAAFKKNLRGSPAHRSFSAAPGKIELDRHISIGR